MPPAVLTTQDEHRTMLASCEALIATARAAARDLLASVRRVALDAVPTSWSAPQDRLG
jgi:hypothetical protein